MSQLSLRFTDWFKGLPKAAADAMLSLLRKLAALQKLQADEV